MRDARDCKRSYMRSSKIADSLRGFNSSETYVTVKIKLKQLCHCGSGKKFHSCCFGTLNHKKCTKGLNLKQEQAIQPALDELKTRLKNMGYMA
jgi:hypothetical protein